MERIRRSFTFSGRSKRRQAEEERKKSTGHHNSEENGIENPEAGATAAASGGDRVHNPETELETLRKRFGDAEDRYREAHGLKRTLAKENEDLRAELLDLRARYGKVEKELTSLKSENTQLLAEMSQLDCDREDLQEKLQRHTHALGKELQDSHAVLHQHVHKEEEMQKECKKLKQLISQTTPEFATKLQEMKDNFPVVLHAVYKGVSEKFVKKSMDELVKAAGYIKPSINEWTGEREVAEPAAVVVFFCLVSDQSTVGEDIKRVSSLGKTAVLVPLGHTEGPLSISSTSMLPVSSSLIKIDVSASDGCLPLQYITKIVDACKVTRFNAALPLLFQ